MSSISCSAVTNPTLNAKDPAYKRRAKKHKERITELCCPITSSKKKEKKKTSGTQGIRLHACSGKLPYDLIAHFDNIFLRKAVNKL